eukprot:TRINITY_DN13768_c0_g1_i3.p1 TRINITY_DN13768_c0_g1~~TRINITY_DN13768_c0_g1_i3.p1  ORF type:complete len:2019 (+),score=545.86 TRINITY_DN13768_c0_g1_i3:172-6228(+)
MEVSVVRTANVSKGSLLSLSAGGSRRQAQLQSRQKFAFGSSCIDAATAPGGDGIKLDVLGSLGDAVVPPGALHGADTGDEARTVEVPLKVRAVSSRSAAKRSAAEEQGMLVSLAVRPTASSWEVPEDVGPKTPTKASAQKPSAPDEGAGLPTGDQLLRTPALLKPTSPAKMSATFPSGPFLPQDRQEATVHRHKAALQARNYLETHDILPFVEKLLRTLVQDRPADPWGLIASLLPVGEANIVEEECHAVSFEMCLSEMTIDTFDKQKQQDYVTQLSRGLGCDYVQIVGIKGGSVMVETVAVGFEDVSRAAEAAEKISSKSAAVLSEQVWGKIEVQNTPSLVKKLHRPSPWLQGRRKAARLEETRRKQLEELRARGSDAIGLAVADGRLEQILNRAARHSQDALELRRQAAAATLCQRAAAGAFNRHPQVNERVRREARGELAAGEESGALGQALGKVVTSHSKKLEEARGKVRGHIEREAVAAAASASAPAAPARKLSKTRSTAVAALEKAEQEGCLDVVLSTLLESHDATRVQALEQLSKAFGSGALERGLSVKVAQALRKSAVQTLLRANEEGRLADTAAQCPAPEQAAVPKEGFQGLPTVAEEPSLLSDSSWFQSDDKLEALTMVDISFGNLLFDKMALSANICEEFLGLVKAAMAEYVGVSIKKINAQVLHGSNIVSTAIFPGSSSIAERIQAQVEKESDSLLRHIQAYVLEVAGIDKTMAPGTSMSSGLGMALVGASVRTKVIASSGQHFYFGATGSTVLPDANSTGGLNDSMVWSPSVGEPSFMHEDSELTELSASVTCLADALDLSVQQSDKVEARSLRNAARALDTIFVAEAEKREAAGAAAADLAQNCMPGALLEEDLRSGYTSPMASRPGTSFTALPSRPGTGLTGAYLQEEKDLADALEEKRTEVEGRALAKAARMAPPSKEAWDVAMTLLPMIVPGWMEDGGLETSPMNSRASSARGPSEMHRVKDAPASVASSVISAIRSEQDLASASSQVWPEFMVRAVSKPASDPSSAIESFAGSNEDMSWLAAEASMQSFLMQELWKADETKQEVLLDAEDVQLENKVAQPEAARPCGLDLQNSLRWAGLSGEDLRELYSRFLVSRPPKPAALPTDVPPKAKSASKKAPLPAPKEIKVSFAIENIDFHKLSVETKQDIEKAAVRRIAAASGVDEQRVRVMLSAGSVQVYASVDVARGSTAGQLRGIKSSLGGNSGLSTTQAVLEDVGKMPSIESAKIIVDQPLTVSAPKAVFVDKDKKEVEVPEEGDDIAFDEADVVAEDEVFVETATEDSKGKGVDDLTFLTNVPDDEADAQPAASNRKKFVRGSAYEELPPVEGEEEEAEAKPKAQPPLAKLEEEMEAKVVLDLRDPMPTHDVHPAPGSTKSSARSVDSGTQQVAEQFLNSAVSRASVGAARPSVTMDGMSSTTSMAAPGEKVAEQFLNTAMSRAAVGATQSVTLDGLSSVSNMNASGPSAQKVAEQFLASAVSRAAVGATKSVTTDALSSAQSSATATGPQAEKAAAAAVADAIQGMQESRSATAFSGSGSEASGVDEEAALALQQATDVNRIIRQCDEHSAAALFSASSSIDWAAAVASQVKVQCKCGSVFMHDSKFCRKCGAARLDLETPVVPLEVERFVCGCGHAVLADARFCNKCGSPIPGRVEVLEKRAPAPRDIELLDDVRWGRSDLTSLHALFVARPPAKPAAPARPAQEEEEAGAAKAALTQVAKPEPPRPAAIELLDGVRWGRSDLQLLHSKFAAQRPPAKPAAPARPAQEEERAETGEAKAAPAQVAKPEPPRPAAIALLDGVRWGRSDLQALHAKFAVQRPSKLAMAVDPVVETAVAKSAPRLDSEASKKPAAMCSLEFADLVRWGRCDLSRIYLRFPAYRPSKPAMVVDAAVETAAPKSAPRLDSEASKKLATVCGLDLADLTRWGRSNLSRLYLRFPAYRRSESLREHEDKVEEEFQVFLEECNAVHANNESLRLENLTLREKLEALLALDTPSETPTPSDTSRG